MHFKTIITVYISDKIIHIYIIIIIIILYIINNIFLFYIKYNKTLERYYSKINKM